MKSDLVSVIIPTYNRAHLVGRAIQSALNQTYKNMEIIVVDDGSTDNTEEIVKSFNDERMRYIQHDKNKGGAVARNTGMKIARGEFIQFLDSDDCITLDKIEIQVNVLKNPKDSCAICDFIYINSRSSFSKPVRNDGNIHDYIAKFRSISISTPLIRKNSLLSGLTWNEQIKRNQDMDFMFKYFISIKRWIYTPGFHSLYMQHKDKRISDDYPNGVQCFELYKSMRYFVKNNINDIPKENLWVLNKYRNKLLAIFLRQWKKKILSWKGNK